jgi:hypothetical protein
MQVTDSDKVLVDRATLLKTAADLGDEALFLEVAEDIDWSRRSATEFTQAVRLALAAGAHLFARKLAARGAERYHDHEELQKMARVLAPPRVATADLPPDKSVRENQTWLREHADEYRGQWVALRGGDLLVAAPTANEAWEHLESKEDVLLTRVL